MKKVTWVIGCIVLMSSYQSICEEDKLESVDRAARERKEEWEEQCRREEAKREEIRERERDIYEDMDRGIEEQRSGKVGIKPDIDPRFHPGPGTPWYNPDTGEYNPPESDGGGEDGFISVEGKCKKSEDSDDDTPVDHHKMSPKKINKTFPKSKTKKPKLMKKFE